MLNAGAAVLGVHGMRARWTSTTLRTGLQRSSAAWFMIPTSVSNEELARTLSSTVYLLLARGRVEAAATPVESLVQPPDLLPTVLVFDDICTGGEMLNRYRWRGPNPGLTVPYTKVSRAGRTVGLEARAPQVIAVDLDAMVQTTTPAGQGGDASDDDWRLVEKVEIHDGRPATSPVATPLALACVALGRTLVPPIRARWPVVPGRG